MAESRQLARWVPLLGVGLGLGSLPGLWPVPWPYMAILAVALGYGVLALLAAPRHRQLISWAPLAYALMMWTAWLSALYGLPDDPVTPLALLGCLTQLTTLYVLLFLQHPAEEAARWAGAVLLIFVLSALPHSLQTLSGRTPFDGLTLSLTVLAAHGLLILVLRAFGRSHAAVVREQARAQALQDLAYRDPLTGLHNRRAFEHDLSGTPLDGSLLVIIDIDGLKTVNDTRGHMVGDDLLRRFAAGFAGLVEPAGRAYRLGGDEFALLIPDGTVEATEQGVAGVVGELRAVYPVAGASLGTAYRREDEAVSAWLARADRAMYGRKVRIERPAGSELSDPEEA